jgi:hypothetical protein
MQSVGTFVVQFLKSPFIAAVATALLFVTAYLEQHLDVGILSLVFMIFCLIYVGLAAIFSVAFLVNIFRRKFISGVAALLAVSMMILAIVRAQTMTEQTFQAIDIARFSVSQDYYLRIVSKQQDQTQRFSWGSGGFLGTNFFYTLVYRPDGSSAFSASVKHDRCNVTVSELQKNFFVESEICQ